MNQLQSEYIDYLEQKLNEAEEDLIRIELSYLDLLADYKHKNTKLRAIIAKDFDC